MIQDEKLVKMMDELGFREEMCGTAMIRVAVDIVDENPDAMMCKHIYPGVAKLMGSTPNRVERCMRTAIERAAQSPRWEEAWEEIGGWGPPTCGEVVRRLARESRVEPVPRRSIRGKVVEQFPELMRGSR